MQSKGNAPTAEQKRWREAVRATGCVITGSIRSEIHHVVGATGKENKVDIGHWFILPLDPFLHRLGPDNVTLWPKRFVENYGTQRELFKKVCQNYEFQKGEPIPVPEEVLSAIAMTRK